MKKKNIPAMPVLPPATTVEGALADLAGAVQIAVELMLEADGERTSAYGKTLIFALRQWQDTGFVKKEAQAVAEEIAGAYLSAYEPPEAL